MGRCIMKSLNSLCLIDSKSKDLDKVLCCNLVEKVGISIANAEDLAKEITFHDSQEFRDAT